MGTVVLAPQDCLSSPHSQQNHYFSSMAYRPSSASRAGRKGSQASISASPPASDCARRDYSGGAIAGDGRGLLPIPYPPGQARALSKTSSPSKVLSQPLPRGGRAAPSTSKPKLSRTVSAILPSPQIGSPPLLNGEKLHLLNGRLPFKVVQSNGPGNIVEAARYNNLLLSKKFVDVRNGVLKKVSNTSEHASGLKKREHPDGHQGLKSTSKVSQDGLVRKGHTKEVDGKKTVKGRWPEKSQSGKEVGEKSRQGDISVVTILQRPKNKEAAAELIAKFFQKAAGPEVSDVNDERAEGTSDDLSDFKKSDGMVVKSETEGLSEFESSSKVGTCQTRSFPTTEHLFLGVPGLSADEDAQEVPMEGVMDGIHLTLAATRLSECVVGQCDAEPSSSPETEEDMAHGFGYDNFALWERWAGPAYINSPPPTALPLPRFPRKQSKTEPASITDQYEEVTSDQIPARSSFNSPLFTRMSGWEHSGIALDAAVTATKDLKRILNLDFCSL